jgi:serine/threonine protein kinase/Tfp pilus assembly protein PilF
MIGKTILHYKIIEKLGEGGMGVVYLAEDFNLERKVSIKFLPHHIAGNSEEGKRFKIEAKAAAALNHPNIATIHAIEESGEDTFIVMEFIDGIELKERIKSDPIPINEAINIAIQIAEGLKAAHKKGIVHRDIKSQNIMISENGKVKIMDFGLAKVGAGSQVTKIGSTMGTLAYMSPEQTRGEALDHRTDIWSLGVVFYEMVSGRLPFTGEYDQVILYNINSTEPEPAINFSSDLSSEITSVIKKTLQKDRQKRYQNIGRLLGDLYKIIEEHTPEETKDYINKEIPSIAVLPFLNMSSEQENEYFGDGLAEELINNLSKLDGLHVAARTSVFRFRNKDVGIKEIGKELCVSHLLEGSVRKSGNRLRITAQLINLKDGYDIWSEKYDRELNDIFAIQDEISMAIIDHLKVKLLGSEKKNLLKRYTDNQEVYQLYLRGRFHLNRRTPTDILKAIKFFEDVIELEPNYALAYAGLADTYCLLERYGVYPYKNSIPVAETAALKAIEINNLAEAHASLGYVKFINWEWKESEKEFTHAIQLYPKYVVAHHWFAWLLAALGRHKKALSEINIAHQLDPLSLIVNANIGSIYYFNRQFDRAEEHLLRTLEMEPRFVVAHQWLGRCYEQKKIYNKAVEEHQIAIDILGDDPESYASLGHAYAINNNIKKSKDIIIKLDELSEKRFVSKYWYAVVYAGLQDIETCFKYLFDTVEERFDWMAFIKVEPIFDILHSDSRFNKLLVSIGLKDEL